MFSICMLTYNNHDTFQRSLQSMTQLLLDDRVEELVILDNGSHEVALRNLLERTEKMYNKVKVYYSAENLGIAKGRKFLFDECKGEYILSFDSDIVILNADMLLTILLESFKNKDIWLIGGGGGNHPYFPALFRQYIHNLKENPDPTKLTFVEEVAGWFHGFRSSMLVKNGGQVYMDEQFTPFWGEDSDFCMQIRMLGGKCAILGSGLVGHKWSSCDKKATQITIEDMWEKFIQKWYPKFGDLFKFDFDEEFYVKYYKDEIVHKPPLTDYLLQGVKRKFIGNGKFISKLFNIKYEEDSIRYNGELYPVRVFIDKFMNLPAIVENNFHISVDKLQKTRFLVMFHSNDDKKTQHILSDLHKNNKDISVCLVHDKHQSHSKSIEFLKTNFPSYAVHHFPEYYSHTIPQVVSFQKITTEHDFVVFINSEKQDAFSKSQLEYLVTNKYYGTLEKCDIRTVETINEVHHHRMDDSFFLDGVYMKDYQKVKAVLHSRQVNNVLEKSLLMPTPYSIHLTPRHCPKYSLERLISSMVMDERSGRSLVVINAEFDMEEEVTKCSQNIKWLKEMDKCDVMVMNGGTYRHVKFGDLGADYYYIVGETKDHIISTWMRSMSVVNNLESYQNVVFVKDSVEIQDSVLEFLEIAKYSNKAFISNENRLNFDFISFQVPTLIQVFQMFSHISKEKEKNDINIDDSIQLNMQQRMLIDSLWLSKKVEEDDQVMMDYYRLDDKFEPDIDFPVIMED